MNSTSNNFHHDDSPEDRLADALLSEHARLGSGRDEDLIKNILTATVHAGDSGEDIVAAPTNIVNFGAANWMKLAASVAVIVGAIAFGLNASKLTSPNSNVADAPRHSETFHIVKYVESDSQSTQRVQPEQPSAGRNISVTQAAPAVETPATTAQLPNAPFLAESAPVSDGMQGPSVTEMPEPQVKTFSVAAANIERVKGATIYSGEATLRHPEFLIRADSLRVVRNDRSSNGIPTFFAQNAVIEGSNSISRAEAAEISYHASSGQIELRGVVNFIQNGVPLDVAELPETLRVLDGQLIDIDPGVYAQPKLKSPK
ncbi:MAG: hypothetical protein AAF226_08315 [Verrucomicrobiota bacterium]